MKKYLQNRQILEVECFYCKNLHLKPLSEVTRNIKLDRKMFCSRSCQVAYNNTVRIPSANLLKVWEHSRNHPRPFSWYLRCAKKRNKDFNLTYEDLEAQWNKQDGICPYTKIPLSLRHYKDQCDIKYRASLDRIDSSKGYTVDNIEFVSLPINYMKTTMSKEQVLSYIQLIVNNLVEMPSTDSRVFP